MAKRPLMKPYGIKAYGAWTYFDTLKEAVGYCIEAVAGTEGSEQARYATALGYLSEGWTHINTDC